MRCKKKWGSIGANGGLSVVADTSLLLPLLQVLGGFASQRASRHGQRVKVSRGLCWWGGEIQNWLQESVGRAARLITIVYSAVSTIYLGRASIVSARNGQVPSRHLLGEVDGSANFGRDARRRQTMTAGGGLLLVVPGSGPALRQWLRVDCHFYRLKYPVGISDARK
jgi:hypothetical protein